MKLLLCTVYPHPPFPCSMNVLVGCGHLSSFSLVVACPVLPVAHPSLSRVTSLVLLLVITSPFLNVDPQCKQVALGALGALGALRAMHRDTKHIQRRETTFEACWIRGVRSGTGDGARVGPVEPTCVHYCVWWQVGAGTRVCASVAYSSVQPSTLPSVGPYSSLCSVEPSALLSAGCTRGSSHGRQCATQGTCQGSPWTTCQQLIGHHDNLHDTRSHVPSRTGVEKVSEGCGEGHKRLD
jgi:hypothetical protein